MNKEEIINKDEYMPLPLSLARSIEIVLNRHVKHISLGQLSYNHSLDLSYINLIYDGYPFTLTIKRRN